MTRNDGTRYISQPELLTVEAVLETGDVRRAAASLGKSPRTVTNRMSLIYASMQVRSFGQLIHALHRNGQLR